MSISYFDHESLQRWFRDNGDRTHRINYDLDRDSIVFDLGGFEGSWSADIFEKYVIQDLNRRAAEKGFTTGTSASIEFRR